MNQRKPCGFTGDGDIGQELNPHYRLQQKRNHSTGLIKTEKGFPGNRRPFFHGECEEPVVVIGNYMATKEYLKCRSRKFKKQGRQRCA